MRSRLCLKNTLSVILAVDCVSAVNQVQKDKTPTADYATANGPTPYTQAAIILPHVASSSKPF